MSLSDSQAGGLSSTSLSPTLGKYKIIRVIARSNDVVYEAIDPGMNRRVAVKELALSPNLSGQQRRERIERFYREAKAAGNLNHQNIVTVHEVGQEGDRHYIAMEYLEGPSLRDILRMRNALSIREALTVALQLTDALGYAHGQGVVHRDVKPDNIHLIVPNDAVKLTDFGIARILSDPAITSTGQVFGTPSYMSPEQIMSKEVDHRTDIFSLGVVLYEMIVGKKPFIGDSVITITYHIMNTSPNIPNNLPPGVYNLISRALTKDPMQRYQNMASMAADLHSEIAFSDSPYHRTIPPGVLSAKDLSDEQTALVNRGYLPRPTPHAPTIPPVQAYAPPTGIADAVAGGPVGAATSVVANNLPHVSAYDDSTKSAVTLVASVFGVMVLVLVMVFAVAKAWETNHIIEENRLASFFYNKAQTEMTSGDRDSALRDYRRAYDEASTGSAIKVNSEYALSEPVPTPTAVDPSSNSSAPQSVTPDQATTPPAPAPADGTPSAPAPDATTGSAAASADYAAALNLQARGDEGGEITQLAAANGADPTGDIGKKAGEQLAQIYSRRADGALHDGQKDMALNDWQMVVKYAPADPIADEARQKILQYGSDDSSQTAPDGSPAAAGGTPAPGSP